MIGLVIFSLMAFCQLASGAALNATVEDRGWKNDWDQPLNFECGAGQYIYRMKSYHDNKKEDRRWDFECKSGNY